MSDGKAPTRLTLPKLVAPQYRPITLDDSHQQYQQQSVSNGRLIQVQMGTYKTNNGNRSGILYHMSRTPHGLFLLTLDLVLSARNTLKEIRMPQGILTHALIPLTFPRRTTFPLILLWISGPTLTVTLMIQNPLDLI